MIRRNVWRAVAGMCGLLLLAAPAAAQTTTPPSTPRGDVFAGVAFWNEDSDSFTGFHLSGAYRVSRVVALVGDMAVYGDTGYREGRTTLMGGVRVQGTGRHTLFLQLLMGSAPLDDIAIMPGLGFDVRISTRAAIRVAGDVKFSGDDGNTYLGTRLSIGMVLLLGSR